MNAFKLSALAVLGLPLLSACGGDNLTLPSEGRPAHIEIVDGDAQRGPINSELDTLLVVKVTDVQGRPVPGATVEFVIQEDAGGGRVIPESGTTDADGQAATTIRLGTQVGTLIGEARVSPGEGSTPVAVGFTATAFSTEAHTLSMVSGDQQFAPVGTPLGLPLVVKVTDEFGNPIPGVTIHWTAQGGGAVSNESTTTGDDGQTSVTRILGPTAGEQQTVATAQDLAGSPITFTHTATAGNASTVTIVSGNNQDAPAGSELPQPLVVRVLDQDGNPIVGRAVSWVVGTGGGSANPQTSNTGSDGQASTRWTLGSAPGNNTLNAVVSGVGTATFNATATGTGSPSNLAVITQPPTSVTVGATLSPAPVIQIRDAAGHDVAVAGVEITATISSGKGQLEGTRTVATDANGRAQFSDLRITGASGSHKIIFAAEGFRSATSNKIEVEKASTTTTIVSDDPDPSDPGQMVTVSFTVTSPAGTPTGEVEVSASGSASCTAPAPQGSCQIALTTSGNITATYKGSDVFGSSSASTGHTVNSQNLPPVATDDQYSTTSGVAFHAPAEGRPSLLANDADLEGGPLTTTAGTFITQAGGSVTIGNDGSFDYNPPAAPFVGSDSFDYTVSDSGGASDTGTAFITIQ